MLKPLGSEFSMVFPRIPKVCSAHLCPTCVRLSWQLTLLRQLHISLQFFDELLNSLNRSGGFAKFRHCTWRPMDSINILQVFDSSMIFDFTIFIYVHDMNFYARHANMLLYSKISHHVCLAHDESVSLRTSHKLGRNVRGKTLVPNW